MKKLSFAALAFSVVLGQNVFATAPAETMQKPGMTNPTQTTSMNSTAPMQCHHHHLCYHHIKEMLQTMNLDSNQQAKVNSIKDKMKQDQKANWDKMRSLRGQFRTLIESDQMDSGKLDDLINQKKEVYGQIIKTRVTGMHDIYHTLNEQQRAKFKDMIQKCEQEHNK